MTELISDGARRVNTPFLKMLCSESSDFVPKNKTGRQTVLSFKRISEVIFITGYKLII